MGRRLGELLVAEGRISQEVLARALELQDNQARGLRLGAILLRWGLIPETGLLDALSAHHRCPPVQWPTLSTATKEAVDLLSSAQSTRLGAVPFSVDRKTVCVAFANPSNLAAIDEVQAITGKRVVPSVTTEVRLLQAQQRFYKRPLARDIWTIVQRIERPAPPPPVNVAPIAVTPPPVPPSSLWIEPEEETGKFDELSPSSPPAVEGSAAESGADRALEDDSAVEDLLELAPGPEPESMEETETDEPAVEVESNDMAEQTIPVFAAKATEFEGFDSFLEGLRLGELVADRDPFADDTPLADFIEQALAFYEAHPQFRSALAALDDGTIEDLNGSAEDDPAPPAFPMDSTHPSPRRKPSEPSAELTL